MPAVLPTLSDNPVVVAMAAWLNRINRVLLVVSMGALVVTTIILTYAVITRHFLRSPTDWQDEAAVFMLIGATFFCSAYVQSLRGHIGIEVLSSLLPPAINAVRIVIVDALSFLFCAFFAWKSWTLVHEAWRDGQTTTSAFAPPLWIPYLMMALGVTLLALQILVQVLDRLTAKRSGRRASAPVSATLPDE